MKKKILKFLSGGYSFKFPSLAGEFQTGASYLNQTPYVNTDLQNYIANSGNTAITPKTGNPAISLIGSSIIGKASDLLSNSIFGDDTELGRNMGTIFSTGLSSAGNTILNNAVKGSALTEGLSKNVGSSIGGAAAGIASNYLGKGITSAMGNSKLGKFAGQATATAAGTIGAKLLTSGASNLFGTAKSIKAGADALKAAKAAGDATKAALAAKAAGAINPLNLAATAVGMGLQAAFGPSKEYQGKYGSITQGMDMAYDVIQTGLGFVPGIGLAVSAVMALNKGLSNAFGSTSGMCVCAGTKVFTTSGDIVNIEDLVQEQGIIGWSEKTHEIRPQTIKGFVEPRLKECLEFRLNSGKHLKCSIDHPIYVNINNSWKFIPAIELKLDTIVGTVELNSPKLIIEDNVVAIKSIGIQTVYNLETVEDHTYIANGIITHNTKQDAILGSAFMPAPVKWLNVAGAKTTDTFKNLSWLNTEKTNAFMLDAFGNLGDKFDKAREEAGKTYGTFSRHAYKRARDNVNFANTVWGQILDMTRQNEYQNIRALDMSSINNLRYAQMIQGGFTPLAVGKLGMKILNNSINHNLGLRFLSGAALIDNKQMILSRCKEVD